MKYKVGDLFIDTRRGVMTIVEAYDNKHYKCNVYDKIKLCNSVEIISENDLNLLREYSVYRFYPVKENKNLS